MSTLRFVLRMVRRELRAEPARLLLLAGATAAGVAALVAVKSFTTNLRDSIGRQARALLGADLSLSSPRPFSPRVERLLDSLVSGGVASGVARVTSFGAMAYVPRSSGARLAQIAAVEGPYPLYGEIRTEPDSAWSGLQRGRRAVVDPALLTALGARPGDTLALGEARFAIAGTLASAPGEIGFRSVFGQRVFIPARYLGETKLLGVGAQVRYTAYLKLAPGRSAQAIAGRHGPLLRAEQVRVRTAAQNQRSLTDTLTRLADYLGLIALAALLLGGIGVASAVTVLVRRRMETIAVLRCLGATAGQVFAVYLVQAAALGLAGGLIGAGLGLALQQAIPALARGLLPVDLRAAPVPRAVALGLATGLWVSVIFALLPLLPVRRIPPLAALRRAVEEAPAPRDPRRWAAAGLLGASVAALAVLQVGDWRAGLAFSAGIGGALAALALAARLLMRALRRWFPGGWPYAWRQGLANLFRPANQTVAVVLALGFGTFLLGTVLLVQHSLLRGLEATGGPRRANLLLIDIQPDQLPAIRRELARRGLPSSDPVPIVPMRIRSVKGRPVARLLTGAGGGEAGNAWALQREYRSTYRDTLVGSERVVAGTWPAAERSSPVPISVEQDLARELGAGVGDEIVWDVQGVAIPSRIASLRAVEWARFEPNFFVVFAAGALERAPQSFVVLTRVDDPAARGRFQRDLAERYANVTTLDLAAIQQVLERLIGRVSLAIRFLALASLAAGAVVLAGATAASRLQRIREAVLLKTLGASRRQLLRIALAEYLALGLLAAVAALGLATAAGWGLARFFFDGRLWVPGPAFLGLGAAVVGLTVGVGLWTGRGALAKPPLEALRD